MARNSPAALKGSPAACQRIVLGRPFYSVTRGQWLIKLGPRLYRTATESEVRRHRFPESENESNLPAPPTELEGQ
jgi:hypothetical protein